jgi:hypothetical protein
MSLCTWRRVQLLKAVIQPNCYNVRSTTTMSIFAYAKAPIIGPAQVKRACHNSQTTSHAQIAHNVEMILAYIVT